MFGAGWHFILYFPVVCFFQSVVSVAEPVKLHPDNDADVLHHVLSVQLLPPRKANKMIP